MQDAEKQKLLDLEMEQEANKKEKKNLDLIIEQLHS